MKKLLFILSVIILSNYNTDISAMDMPDYNTAKTVLGLDMPTYEELENVAVSLQSVYTREGFVITFCYVTDYDTPTGPRSCTTTYPIKIFTRKHGDYNHDQREQYALEKCREIRDFWNRRSIGNKRNTMIRARSYVKEETRIGYPKNQENSGARFHFLYSYRECFERLQLTETEQDPYTSQSKAIWSAIIRQP